MQQLTINLTAEETAQYSAMRRALLQTPEIIIKDFKVQWLRVVGQIGIPKLEDMPRMWLLGDELFGSSRTGELDDRNLRLACDCGRPWNSVAFDSGYWVLDEDLVDGLLAAGVKGYGIAFLHDFDVGQVDYKLQELLVGRVTYL